MGIVEMPRTDVLVNNAGFMPLSLLARVKVTEWDRMIDENIKGVLDGIVSVSACDAAKARAYHQCLLRRRA